LLSFRDAAKVARPDPRPHPTPDLRGGKNTHIRVAQCTCRAVGAEMRLLFLAKKPGAYIWIGNGRADNGGMLHSPQNEAVGKLWTRSLAGPAVDCMLAVLPALADQPSDLGVIPSSG